MKTSDIDITKQIISYYSTIQYYIGRYILFNISLNFMRLKSITII